MSSPADITAELVSLVRESGLHSEDVRHITVIIEPPALMICYKVRDPAGALIIGPNGDFETAVAELVPVSINEAQLSDQT